MLGGMLTGVPALADFRCEWRALAVGVAATLPLLVAFAAIWSSPRSELREIRETLERLLPRLLGDEGGSWRLRVIALAVAAGIGEETLFRGFVQGSLAHVLGPTAALALASVVFGLAHAVTPAYAMIATIMGLYLGCAWHVSGNLLVPVTIHAVYDGVAIGYVILEMRSRRAAAE